MTRNIPERPRTTQNDPEQAGTTRWHSDGVLAALKEERGGRPLMRRKKGSFVPSTLKIAVDVGKYKNDC